MPGGISLVPKIALDPAPQLGGDLDLNSHKIADGGVLQLYNDSANHKVVLNAVSGNTSIVAAPSGTGAIMASLGGDARGNYAVDLQIDRGGLSGNVASGATSAVVGARSRASGDNSCAFGYGASAEGLGSMAISGALASGESSTAIGNSTSSGAFSVALGFYAASSGESSIAFAFGESAGQYSVAFPVGYALGVGSAAFYGAMANGEKSVAFPDSIASGLGSAAFYGATTTAEATYSISTVHATAYLTCQCSQSNAHSLTGAKAQTHVLVESAQTSGTTPVALTLEGFTALVLPNKTSWAFRILLIARSTDSSSINAAWNIFGCIKRDATAASTAIQGGIQYGTPINPDNWECQITADTLVGSLKIMVMGEANKTINWAARVEMAEVSESLS